MTSELATPIAAPLDYPKAPHESARVGFAFSAWWTLYTLTLRQHLRGKRWLVMGLPFLLPAGLAVFFRRTAHGAPSLEMEFRLAYILIPQALLPLLALTYSSGIIQDELEEQTFTYLLIRPIPKWAIYGVKLLATLTTAVTLSAIFTSLTYLAIYTGSHSEVTNVPFRCLTALLTHGLAVAAYCCLFGLISVLTRRTLIAGILYIAIVEGLLANLPLSLRLLTVIYYSRLIAYRTLGFDIPVPGGQTHDIAADAWHLDPVADPGLLEHPTRTTCVIVLLTAGLVLSAVAAFLCSRREFHVKTPEKG